MSKKLNKLFTAAMLAGGAALGILYYRRQRELQDLEELNDFDDYETPAETETAGQETKSPAEKPVPTCEESVFSEEEPSFSEETSAEVHFTELE